ncbi:hypothetical protein HYW19_03970 [Candidatus Woesearchaeota archaeon]|nr:hypothetical protein [Candidatus Woesearchaeota archaeon]
MAFRLDLKLEDMKKQIGWDDANFYDVPSRLAVPNPKYPIPFRFTYTSQL